MPIAVTVCDDHPVYARGLAGLLEQESDDIEVVAIAATADEAERAVRDLLPDVVLMDIRMPDVDGIEATRRIQAMSPSTKTVMLTASDDEVDLYQALRAGASGYVVKDSDVAEIVGAIRSVCRGNLVIPAGLVASFVKDLEGADPEALSDLEREVLEGIARGETNREIAARLHMSERTVRRRVEDVYAKLHFADRIEAAVYAAKRGMGEGGPRSR